MVVEFVLWGCKLAVGTSEADCALGLGVDWGGLGGRRWAGRPAFVVGSRSRYRPGAFLTRPARLTIAGFGGGGVGARGSISWNMAPTAVSLGQQNFGFASNHTHWYRHVVLLYLLHASLSSLFPLKRYKAELFSSPLPKS